MTEKKLSPLGELLITKGITQSQFIQMLAAGGHTYKRSFISLHVNGKRSFMTTETAKIFAKTLGVPMEQIC